MAQKQNPRSSPEDLRAEIARKLGDLTTGELEALERFMQVETLDRLLNESLDNNATPKQEQA